MFNIIKVISEKAEMLTLCDDRKVFYRNAKSKTCSLLLAVHKMLN